MRKTNKTVAKKRGLIMETSRCQIGRMKEVVSISILVHHLIEGNTIGEALKEMMEPSSRLT